MSWKATRGNISTMFELSFSVPTEDITPVYRHVHHAQCLRYLETARLRFLESIGFPSEAFIAQGLFLVIVNLSITYKRELFQEPLIITCENFRSRGRELLMDQRIFKERRKVAVEAVVSSMFMDGTTKRAVSIPQNFATSISLPPFEVCHGA